MITSSNALIWVQFLLNHKRDYCPSPSKEQESGVLVPQGKQKLIQYLFLVGTDYRYLLSKNGINSLKIPSVR